MASLIVDLRDVLRSLPRERAYGATVVLTFALTLGATTAVFSIVNGVLLEPLTFSESDRLVAVREVWKQFAERFPMLAVNARHFEHCERCATSEARLSQAMGAADRLDMSTVDRSIVNG